ncbi:uncharacterized protein [Mytilus edulis]|uniref:uncharacterized protein n=1 Tax=Mytilus edulis TaxID=6550 RepID=UPI0039F08FE1
MTAQPTSSRTMSGIIKFDIVKFSVGINNMSAYKSTGKFICEKAGLYLISVSIRSKTNDAQYYVYHNDMNAAAISDTEIGYNSHGGSMALTGIIVHALQLHPNDSVWVYCPGTYCIEGQPWSTLTIIKLK